MTLPIARASLASCLLVVTSVWCSSSAQGKTEPPTLSRRLVYVVGPSDSERLFIAQQRLNTELRLAGYDPAFIQPNFVFDCSTESALVHKLKQDGAAALIQLSYSVQHDTYRARLCITRTLHGSLLEVESPRAVSDLGFLTMYVAEALFGAELSGTAPVQSPIAATEPPPPVTKPTQIEPVDAGAQTVAQDRWRLGVRPGVLWLSSNGNGLRTEPLGGAGLSLEAPLQEPLAVPLWFRVDASFGFLGGQLSTDAYVTRMRVAWFGAGVGYDWPLGPGELMVGIQAGGLIAFNPTTRAHPDAGDASRVGSLAAWATYSLPLTKELWLQPRAGAGTLLPAVEIESAGERDGTWGQLLLQAGLGLAYEL